MSELLQFFNNNVITIIMAFIALSVSLVKIIEVLVKKVFPKSNTLSEEEYKNLLEINENVKKLLFCLKNESILTLEERTWLKNLEDIHNRTDDNGVPLTFFPRSYIDTQKEMTKILNNVSLYQQKTTFILESILRELDKLDRIDRKDP